jgi:hypothetical protein
MNKKTKNAYEGLVFHKNRGNRCVMKLKHWLSFSTFLVSSSLSFASGEDKTQE